MTLPPGHTHTWPEVLRPYKVMGGMALVTFLLYALHEKSKLEEKQWSR